MIDAALARRPCNEGLSPSRCECRPPPRQTSWPALSARNRETAVRSHQPPSLFGQQIQAQRVDGFVFRICSGGHRRGQGCISAYCHSAVTRRTSEICTCTSPTQAALLGNDSPSDNTHAPASRSSRKLRPASGETSPGPDSPGKFVPADPLDSSRGKSFLDIGSATSSPLIDAAAGFQPPSIKHRVLGDHSAVSGRQQERTAISRQKATLSGPHSFGVLGQRVMAVYLLNSTSSWARRALSVKGADDNCHHPSSSDPWGVK
jgi:hypothetical protein